MSALRVLVQFALITNTLMGVARLLKGLEMSIRERVMIAVAGGDEFCVNQVVEMIGCKRTAVCNAVIYLRDKGALTVTRRVNHSMYFKESAPGALRALRAKSDIFDQCRQNWQGYSIHKIFGSAQRAPA